MRYSNNLNIILKASEKAVNYILRDFFEIGNLQANSKTAQKFTNAAFQRVKKIIIDDLTKFRPSYNYYFSDGEKIINDENSEYHYVIFPISGLSNLQRACPDFVIAIALNYGKNFEESHPVAVVINKAIPSEVFYCEKGFGSYLNNRRIKISNKSKEDALLVNNTKYLEKTNIQNRQILIRNYGSKILELAYLACNRIDLVSLENANQKLVLPFTLIASEAEAGQKNLDDDNQILLMNKSLL